MKILFIFPNYDCPVGISIGVSYLSSILANNGHDTKILHINEEIGYSFDIRKIIEDIKLYSPNLISISTGENHYDDMVKLAYAIKGELNTPIALGGIHATLNYEKIAEQEKCFDYLMLGDGENSILELVNNLNGNDTNILNVWKITKEKIYKNKMRPLVPKLKLPYMDLDKWQFEKITKMRRGWINVSVNRGCPYRCSFCHNVGEVKILQKNYNAPNSWNQTLGYLRLRDINNMISELKYIKEKYNYVKAFSFIDDTLTYDKEHMKKFFIEYKEKINVPFVCLTTVNDVDYELLELMKSANCDMIRFGVESASERIRKNIIKRNFSNEKLIRVFDDCKKLGIRSFAYNIIGHPTETRAEIIDTLKLNARLEPSGMRLSLGYPYKGTQYYDIAKELGVVDESLNYHNYSSGTKFIFSEDDKLWIDKCISLFWWWINSFMNNEASKIYAKLIPILESVPANEWQKEVTRNAFFDLDLEISNYLKERNIKHYSTPFSDRADIAILYDNEITVKKEELDEH